MANNNITTKDNSINPLLGDLTVDTLINCSQVLIFLEMNETEGEPTENEVRGLSLIYKVVRKALDFEIDRAAQPKNKEF